MEEKRRRNNQNLKKICIGVSIICLLICCALIYGVYYLVLLVTSPYSSPHGGEHHSDNCWVPRGHESCAPRYIIAGAMKCGTTSLFQYLTQHPDILSLKSFVLDPSDPAPVTAEKEVRYFIDPMWSTLKFKYGQDKSVSLYLNLFEEIPSPNIVPHPDPDVEKNRGKITGEATPMYICQPGVAKRVHDILPHVKIMIMLRNPVDRSYSEFWFKRSLSGRDQNKNVTGNEKSIETQKLEEKFLQIAFSQCVKNDLEMMKYCDFDSAIQTPSIDRYNEFMYCYMNLSQTLRSANPNVDSICEEGSPIAHLCLVPGFKRNCPPGLAINSVYTWQIGEWLDLFPLNDQLMIIQSEVFYKDTNNMMKNVENFLEINPIDWRNITTKKYNIVNPNPPNMAEMNNNVNNNNNNNNNNNDNKNNDKNKESKDASLTIQDKSNDYPELDNAIRVQLDAVFEPYNQLLYRQLNLQQNFW